MNVIDKRKMLSGVLYNFDVVRDATENEIDALIAARDVLRQAGLLIAPDQYGRLIVKRRDGREIAIGLHV